jgi:hypothetical protein
LTWPPAALTTDLMPDLDISLSSLVIKNANIVQVELVLVQ